MRTRHYQCSSTPPSEKKCTNIKNESNSEQSVDNETLHNKILYISSQSTQLQQNFTNYGVNYESVLFKLKFACLIEIVRANS